MHAVALLQPTIGSASSVPEIVPELYEGMKFACRGHRFKITQICGDTVYLKLAACDWDTPVSKAAVLAAVMSHRDNYQ